MRRGSAPNEVYLSPGEYAVGDSSTVIRTLLGSCVSVTLWHPVLRKGAMSHFLLWTRSGTRGEGLDARYGDESIGLMLRALVAADVNPHECKAKLFGGASMFGRRRLDDPMNVGRDNGVAARAVLNGLGIPIVAESLFGDGHRSVIFVVGTGDVWARQADLERVNLKAER
jgi:chemotaxis protein CheD